MRLLNQEDAVGRFLCPSIEPIANANVIFLERLEGAHQVGAVRLLGQFDFRCEKVHRSQGRAQHSLLVVKYTQPAQLN
jgi:hypothetical protein